jgi:hypothetical protein
MAIYATAKQGVVWCRAKRKLHFVLLIVVGEPLRSTSVDEAEK